MSRLIQLVPQSSSQSDVRFIIMKNFGDEKIITIIDIDDL